MDGMTEASARMLAGEIANRGFSVERNAQAALWACARRRGVDPLVISVAADPTEPTVVRYRALAVVVARYCAQLVEPEEVDLVPEVTRTTIGSSETLSV